MKHTFPIPVFPKVADVFAPLFDVPAGDPWYISFFFLTSGVAREVGFVSFAHLAQTMLAFDELRELFLGTKC